MSRIAFKTFAPWVCDEKLTFDRDVAVLELDEAVLGHLVEADTFARDVFRRDSQVSEIRRLGNNLALEFYGLELWEAVNPDDDLGNYFQLPVALDLSAFEAQHVDSIETCIYSMMTTDGQSLVQLYWEASFGDSARVWTDGIAIEELRSFLKQQPIDDL